jgi:hypothetical protein
MKKLYPDDLALRIKESGDTKYRPSNGTEGERFMELYCYQCAKWPDDPDAPSQCQISFDSYFYDIEHEKYPKEWRYKEGQPTCTAFVDRNPKDERQKDLFGGE